MFCGSIGKIMHFCICKLDFCCPKYRVGGDLLCGLAAK
jgi:hypothetical protein